MTMKEAINKVANELAGRYADAPTAEMIDTAVRRSFAYREPVFCGGNFYVMVEADAVSIRRRVDEFAAREIARIAMG